jgi:hypothetical protein
MEQGKGELEMGLVELQSWIDIDVRERSTAIQRAYYRGWRDHKSSSGFAVERWRECGWTVLLDRAAWLIEVVGQIDSFGAKDWEHGLVVTDHCPVCESS